MSEMRKHDPDRCACRWGEQPCRWCWPDAGPQNAAQAPQDGANGGDVGSGKGEGVSTPQTGAQAPGEGEA
jgi:hypothetical protein